MAGILSPTTTKSQTTNHTYTPRLGTGISNIYKSIKNISVGVGSKARKVIKTFVGVNGKAKSCFNDIATNVTTYTETSQYAALSHYNFWSGWAASTTNPRISFFGGGYSYDTVDMYNASTGTHTVVSSELFKRDDPAALATTNKIYLCFGCSSRYDVSSNITSINTSGTASLVSSTLAHPTSNPCWCDITTSKAFFGLGRKDPYKTEVDKVCYLMSLSSGSCSTVDLSSNTMFSKLGALSNISCYNLGNQYVYFSDCYRDTSVSRYYAFYLTSSGSFSSFQLSNGYSFPSLGVAGMVSDGLYDTAGSHMSNSLTVSWHTSDDIWDNMYYGDYYSDTGLGSQSKGPSSMQPSNQYRDGTINGCCFLAQTEKDSENMVFCKINNNGTITKYPFIMDPSTYDDSVVSCLFGSMNKIMTSYGGYSSAKPFYPRVFSL